MSWVTPLGGLALACSWRGTLPLQSTLGLHSTPWEPLALLHLGTANNVRAIVLQTIFLWVKLGFDVEVLGFHLMWELSLAIDPLGLSP